MLPLLLALPLKLCPRVYFDEALWQELDRFKSQYDYAEHGSNRAKHKELLSNRIIDSIAIAGTPEESYSPLSENYRHGC